MKRHVGTKHEACSSRHWSSSNSVLMYRKKTGKGVLVETAQTHFISYSYFSYFYLNVYWLVRLGCYVCIFRGDHTPPYQCKAER